MEKEYLLSDILSTYQKQDKELSVISPIENKTVLINTNLYFDFYTEIYFLKCIIRPIFNPEFIGKNNVKNEITFDQCLILDHFTFESKNLHRLNIYNCEINNKKTFYFKGQIDFVFISNTKLGKIKTPNFSFDEVKLFSLSVKNIDSSRNLSFNNTNNQIERQLQIENCTFSSINLSNLTLKGRVLIRNLKIIDKLRIYNSNFNKTINIDNNEINSLELDDVFFYGNTSIQDNTINRIAFKNTFFSSPALFDGLKTNIKNYSAIDRKTIRTIKQELQKTENRIDFDKYRSYELELYKKELKGNSTIWNKEWWHGDLLILRLNSLFSNHGLSWKKALGMTFLFSLLFYTMLYGVERFHNKLSIKEISFDQYTSGYFKFFLVTNFYDPLSEDKEYLNHFLEWFFFILGKITIGYGLFETVQSFRKYKK